MFRPLVNTRMGWVVFLVCFSCLSGWTPSLSQDFWTLTKSSSARAQGKPNYDKLLGQYAEAILQMEPLRLQSFQEVQDLMGGALPKNVCKKSDLTDPVNTICDRFFNESADIIRGTGLSLTDFNAITEEVRKNKTLKDQLDQELIRRKGN